VVPHVAAPFDVAADKKTFISQWLKQGYKLEDLRAIVAHVTLNEIKKK